MAAFLRSSEEV